MNIQRSLTGAERAKRWRATMRAKGLRPRTFWLPNLSDAQVQEKIRQQCEALNEWYERHPEVLDELEEMRGDPDDLK